MRKRTLSAFCFVFLVSFLFYGAYSGVFLAGLDSHTLFESLALIAFVSILFGSAVAFSIYQTNESDESFAISTEISEGAGNFAKAFALLKTRAFTAFWIAFSLIGLGYFLLASRLSILGGILVFAGQIEWFTSRQRLQSFVENNKSVAIQLEDSLRWILRLMDAFALLITVAVVGALSSYAEIMNTAGMLALCFFLALAFMIYWHRTNRLPFDMLFAIKSMIVMVWVLLISMTLNYGLDYRKPAKVNVVSYKDCPNPKNEFFTNGGEKIELNNSHAEQIEGCKFFYSMERLPGLDEKVETTHHAGALGISWRKMSLAQ